MKKLLFVFSILCVSARSNGFQILSAVTNPCHEAITLGVVGYGPVEFQGLPASLGLLNRFVAKANEIGVPNDKASVALVKEMSARFNWTGLNLTTQFILASFVAGARMPDTHGFSIIDIDHIRDNHLTDSAQATHMLRKRENDGPNGNVSAIAQTRAQITDFINGVLSSWAQPASLLTTQTWAFPFYGEQNVQLFAPAFNLGQVAHSIEDSYSHTIRDDQFQILAVANYIETMTDDLSEDRDGPPHSERLDQCNMKDSFDNMRVLEAQRQLTLVFNEIDSLLNSNTTSDSTVETILDTTFVYKPGCINSNHYCDSVWIDKSREQPSQPYKLGFNCALVKSIAGGPPRPGGPSGPMKSIGLILLFLPIVVSRLLRRRRIIMVSPFV